MAAAVDNIIAKNLAAVVIVNEQFHQPFSTKVVYATWICI